MASRPGPVRRVLGDVFSGLWRLLDFTRRLVLNLLFLALLAVFAIAWYAGSRVTPLQENTALVLNLSGDLVEQYAGSTSEALLADALGERRRETRLRDVLAALDGAASDPNIVRAVLVLDDLSGGGTASLREVAAALDRFRKAGKQVVAWGSSFSQRQYFLAAHADELYLHPYGAVELRGLGDQRLYFADALAKLGITMHAFQAGKYKSAIEPLTRNAPSPEALQADQAWLDDLWSTWTREVEAARKLPKGAIAQIIDNAPQKLEAVQGDVAKLAAQEKLVDALKTRDEFRALMIERGAAASAKQGTFRQVAFDQYLAHVADKRGDAVAVVVAQGEIIDDDAPQGMVGGRATAELIRRAREDEGVKALVLRVDSPGGSAFGSELIRREVELTRKAGKPVVASMGDQAASGGYWIAMSADTIVADPTTITGSIGVFGVLPTFENTLEKLSIGSGGASTTWLAGAASPLRPLDKRLEQMVQSSIGHIYRQFIGQVAASRKSTPEKINEVAQGRVWTGQQAKAHGLVDELGGFQRALALAAERGGLAADARVTYVERDPRGIDRWLSLLLGQVTAGLHAQFGLQLPFGLEAIRAELPAELRVFRDAHAHPLRGYAYCFCRVE
jgi:protease-4